MQKTGAERVRNEYVKHTRKVRHAYDYAKS